MSNDRRKKGEEKKKKRKLSIKKQSFTSGRSMAL